MIIIPNVLNNDQIEAITDLLDKCSNIETQETYGRYMFHDIIWDHDINLQSTALHLVEEAVGEKLMWTGAVCAEYTADAGYPNLPPHFDGDSTDYIMTYQLSSNREWGVGVDYEVCYLKDNMGVIFEPNKNIHWRPHTTFSDGEFVRVMFFRFSKPNMTDYSYMALSMDDPVFDDIKAFRDSL